ncbi:MAG: hypothetical protein CBC22_07055 [Alphaproteobacteria bacterium TMED62]|nr:MAG: hypothetical protein CBC22_07055 [Alphaproteobacteria bacterium TMED62]|tara:strand:+ start:18135 stop:18518 length:384 start_codon:yes stop_codon:yes gene_type:complete
MRKQINEYKKSNIRQKSNTKDSYDVINELLRELNSRLKKSLILMEKQSIDKAKENAKKAQNIAFALQNCLDVKNGGEIAENLNFLYRHIRFATQSYIEKEKSDLLSSAHFVSNEILEGWKGMNSAVA